MTVWQIFKWPLVISVLTMAGLLAGLVSDGWGDVLAGIGLFIPAGVAIWFGVRGRRSHS